MRLTSLGSGSEGNALLVSVKDGASETTVMFDCGFNLNETQRRLERVGCSPNDISAVVITHEHGDHADGTAAFARRYKIPVWMSKGTHQALMKSRKKYNFSGVELNFCKDGDTFSVGSLQISAFAITHDAVEPLQFHVTDGKVKFGMLTDTGQITPHIANVLSDCDVLMLECNYDEGMLKSSEYDYWLRNRISSGDGHLSNECVSEFLARTNLSRLKKVIGVHLSRKTNRPELVRQALEKAVNPERTEIVIAGQDDGFEWIDIS